jgi:uncharacterized protein
MRLLSIFITFCIVPYSYAATLTAGKNVEILAFNGQKYSDGIFEKSDLILPDGENQIVVRYSKNFAKDGSVTSKPYIFNIQTDKHTSITVKTFNRYKQAQKAVEAGITWIVVKQNGSEKISNADMLLGEGFFPYRDIEKLIAKYNQEHGIILSSRVAKAKDTPSISSRDKHSAHSSKFQTKQLIEAYNSASKADQKAFRAWLNAQEIK